MDSSKLVFLNLLKLSDLSCANQLSILIEDYFDKKGIQYLRYEDNVISKARHDAKGFFLGCASEQDYNKINQYLDNIYNIMGNSVSVFIICADSVYDQYQPLLKERRKFRSSYIFKESEVQDKASFIGNLEVYLFSTNRQNQNTPPQLLRGFVTPTPNQEMLYLYNYGDENPHITGTWGDGCYSSTSFSGNKKEKYLELNNGSGFSTQVKVNLNNYTKLCVEHTGSITIGLDTKLRDKNKGKVNKFDKTLTNVTTTLGYTYVDINDIVDEFYIRIMANNSCQIQKIYFINEDMREERLSETFMTKSECEEMLEDYWETPIKIGVLSISNDIEDINAINEIVDGLYGLKSFNGVETYNIGYYGNFDCALNEIWEEAKYWEKCNKNHPDIFIIVGNQDEKNGIQCLYEEGREDLVNIHTFIGISDIPTTYESLKDVPILPSQSRAEEIMTYILKQLPINGYVKFDVVRKKNEWSSYISVDGWEESTFRSPLGGEKFKDNFLFTLQRTYSKRCSGTGGCDGTFTSIAVLPDYTINYLLYYKNETDSKVVKFYNEINNAISIYYGGDGTGWSSKCVSKKNNFTYNRNDVLSSDCCFCICSSDDDCNEIVSLIIETNQTDNPNIAFFIVCESDKYKWWKEYFTQNLSFNMLNSPFYIITYDDILKNVNNTLDALYSLIDYYNDHRVENIKTFAYKRHILFDKWASTQSTDTTIFIDDDYKGNKVGINDNIKLLNVLKGKEKYIVLFDYQNDDNEQLKINYDIDEQNIKTSNTNHTYYIEIDLTDQDKNELFDLSFDGGGYLSNVFIYTMIDENGKTSGNIELEDATDDPAVQPIHSITNVLELDYGYNNQILSVTPTVDLAGHTLKYQWYKCNTIDKQSPIKVGTNSSTYNISNGLEGCSTNYYYCEISAMRDNNGKTASYITDVATVRVKHDDTAPTPATIVKQPQSITLPCNYKTSDVINITTTTDNNHDVTYQWYETDDLEKTHSRLIEGATNSTFEIPLGEMNGTVLYYYCELTTTRYTNLMDNLSIVTLSDISTVTIEAEPVMVYNQGDECAEIVGGWNNKFYSTYFGTVGFGGTKESRYMRLVDDSTSLYGSSGYCTDQPVDLTYYDKLCVDFQYVALGDAWSQQHSIDLGLSNEPRNGAYNDYVRFDYTGNCTGDFANYTDLKLHTKKMDISSVTGSYYLNFGASSFYYPEQTADIRIHRVYLIPQSLSKKNMIPATPPTIVTQPQNITVDYGYESVSISIEATVEDNHTLSYQWYKCDDLSGYNAQKIDDAIESIYNIPIGKLGETIEYYYCSVTALRTESRLTETLNSNIISFSVNADETSATTPKVTLTLLTDNSLKAEVEPIENHTFTYQWYENPYKNKYSTKHLIIINGATEQIYKPIFNDVINKERYYYCQVTSHLNTNIVNKKTAINSLQITKHKALRPNYYNIGQIKWNKSYSNNQWSGQGNSTIVKNDNLIHCMCGYTTKSPIDVTNYDEVYLNYIVSNLIGENSKIYIGLDTFIKSDQYGTNNEPAFDIQTNTSITNEGKGSIILNVENITGEYYVRFMVDNQVEGETITFTPNGFYARKKNCCVILSDEQTVIKKSLSYGYNETEGQIIQSLDYLSDKPLTYQWYEGSTAIQGANSLTFNVPLDLENTQKQYRFVASYNNQAAFVQDYQVDIGANINLTLSGVEPIGLVHGGVYDNNYQTYNNLPKNKIKNTICFNNKLKHGDEATININWFRCLYSDKNNSEIIKSTDDEGLYIYNNGDNTLFIMDEISGDSIEELAINEKGHLSNDNYEYDIIFNENNICIDVYTNIDACTSVFNDCVYCRCTYDGSLGYFECEDLCANNVYVCKPAEYISEAKSLKFGEKYLVIFEAQSINDDVQNVAIGNSEYAEKLYTGLIAHKSFVEVTKERKVYCVLLDLSDLTIIEDARQNTATRQPKGVCIADESNANISRTDFKVYTIWQSDKVKYLYDFWDSGNTYGYTYKDLRAYENSNVYEYRGDPLILKVGNGGSWMYERFNLLDCSFKKSEEQWCLSAQKIKVVYCIRFNTSKTTFWNVCYQMSGDEYTYTDALTQGDTRLGEILTLPYVLSDKQTDRQYIDIFTFGQKQRQGNMYIYPRIGEAFIYRIYLIKED